MAAALGIGVGSVNTVAAVDTDGASVTDAADLTVLSRASVLHLSPDRAPVLGDDTSEPDAVTVSDFANRVGDPVGILTDDGSTYSGEDLVATAVSCIVHQAASGRHGLPTTVVAHPTVWPPYTVGVLADALEQAGVTGATLVSEAQAVMTWLERTRGTLGDALTVIYDLGGTSLDITLFRSDAHGTETGVLGKPVRSEDFGGAHFDHATMQYVLGNVAEEFGDIDPFAPDTVAALTRLRTRCTAAKEALSSDTEATIGIELPGISTDVRLVRSELEDLIRESLQESVTLVRESIHAAGLESSDVTQVVLTGGSAAIPLVAELLSAELRVPVVAAERPGHTAALGAALLAADNDAGRAAAPTVARMPVVVPTAAPAAPVAAPTVEPDAETVVLAARTPAPTLTEPAATGMSRKKKAGIITASAAAIALLAAGGLSLGTALDIAPSSSGSGSTTSQSSSTSAGAASTSGVPAEAAATGATTPGTE
ncbi:Hsp70 family protein, partial [Rhodococcus sp. A14]|nr:Hsp70 family protein [Rhodococcus sp. A14]